MNPTKKNATCSNAVIITWVQTFEHLEQDLAQYPGALTVIISVVLMATEYCIAWLPLNLFNHPYGWTFRLPLTFYPYE